MNNIVILPIVIPLLTAIISVFFQKQVNMQKWLSAIGATITIIGSLYIVQKVAAEGILTLNLGGWVPPFGITLVADMFSALLVLTSSIVTFACMLYAFHTIDTERTTHFFYPLFMLLVCGVHGSFITGDLFNLFVCFEVMLIASYVLLSHGGAKIQLRETIKYVLINVISSTLFVVAMAYLYSIVGTLNMAHLSTRIAESGQTGMLTALSLLFLTVFGLKAALFLYFWLPGSYGAPPTAVAAIFAALLTKVGVYSIVRLFSLVFYHQPDITHTIILWLSAFTMIFGAIGAVAYRDVRKILAYNVIVAIGFMLFGFAISSPNALTGTLYYLIQDMIVKALIFLLGGAMIRMAKTHRLDEMSGLIRHRPTLGWFFFIAALTLAGIPPFSGFVGKVLVLQAGMESANYIVATIGLLTSLLILYSILKIFINGFWGETILSEEEAGPSKGAVLPSFILIVLIIFMGIGAEWVLEYVQLAVDIIVHPELYIQAVFPFDH